MILVSKNLPHFSIEPLREPNLSFQIDFVSFASEPWANLPVPHSEYRQFNSQLYVMGKEG